MSNQRRTNSRVKRRPIRKKQPRQRTPFELLQFQFLGCARCSYFLTGYRAIVGLDVVTEVADSAENNWLNLQWHEKIPYLIERSYGFSIRSDQLHIEGCCMECQRAFIFKTEESLEFAIQATPKVRASNG